MGQYYKIANIDNSEFIHPFDFNSGLKLMELSSGSSGAMQPVAQLIQAGKPWFGARLVVTGDYADEGRFVPKSHSTKSLYAYLEEHGKQVSPDEVQLRVGPSSNPTQDELTLSVLGRKFDYHFVNRDPRFVKLLDSDNWSSVVLEDFDDFLEMIDCRASSNLAALQDDFSGCLHWFFLFQQGVVTQFRFEKFKNPNLFEISEDGSVSVPMQLSKGRYSESEKKDVRITFPCSVLSVLEKFEMVPDARSKFRPQKLLGLNT